MTPRRYGDLLVNRSDLAVRLESAHAQAGDVKAPGHRALIGLKGGWCWLSSLAVADAPCWIPTNEQLRKRQFSILLEQGLSFL